MKRLRKLVDERVRFFGVGEYGGRTWRPHYHAALFGLSHPDAVGAAWPKGFAHVGELNQESAAYIAGYTVKKLTKRDDPRLEGRHPEFARMSLRPGIGAGAAEEIAGATARWLRGAEDVPSQVRAMGRLWPLGRYLRRRVRLELGMAAGEPPAIGEARSLELQVELSKEGGREKREQKRANQAARARALIAIQESKKGIGL